MKILCIKDPVRSSINDFRVRNRAITNPSFAVGRLNWLKKEDDEQSAFLQFSKNHHSCILYGV